MGCTTSQGHTLMSIFITIFVILLLSCTIWLVVRVLKAASDQDHPISEVEAAVTSMVLLMCTITVSYQAITSVVLKPDVPQSSQVTYDRNHQPIRVACNDRKRPKFKTRKGRP